MDEKEFKTPCESLTGSDDGCCVAPAGFDPAAARPSIQPVESLTAENTQLASEEKLDQTQAVDHDKTSVALEEQPSSTAESEVAVGSTGDTAAVTPAAEQPVREKLAPKPSETSSEFYKRIRNTVSRREMCDLIGKEYG